MVYLHFTPRNIKMKKTHIKKSYVFVLLFMGVATIKAQDNSTVKISNVLDDWHKAAAVANFDKYFGLMSESAIFIGTDATENWNKASFKVFAKPFFDKGKAWNFISIERHIYLSEDKKIAWFDELLNTQMKICRGSGVVVFKNGTWKIEQYVLSMTVPNDNTDEIIKIKAPIEDALLLKYGK